MFHYSIGCRWLVFVSTTLASRFTENKWTNLIGGTGQGKSWMSQAELNVTQKTHTFCSPLQCAWPHWAQQLRRADGAHRSRSWKEEERQQVPWRFILYSSPIHTLKRFQFPLTVPRALPYCFYLHSKTISVSKSVWSEQIDKHIYSRQRNEGEVIYGVIFPALQFEEDS